MCFRVVMTLNITSMSSPMSSLRIAAYFQCSSESVGLCAWVCVCACVHAGMWVGVHVKVCERTCTCLQRGVRVRGVRARCKCAGTPSPHQGCERRVAARAIARV